MPEALLAEVGAEETELGAEQSSRSAAAFSPAVGSAWSRWMPDATTAFFLGLLLCASGWVSPPVALLAGLGYGFTVRVHPLRREAGSLAKVLLQLSVVLLGFGMKLHEVVHAGRSGFLYTAVSISAAIALGLLLGKVLRVGGKASYLITMGTAICGGSAIAAVAPVIGADQEEISVAMGTVFVLNSLALFLFPFLGHRLHLSQDQFGLWAALAIHDTSSVVGATARYGSEALAVGTTIKLTRALWIVPVSLVTALVVSHGAAGVRADGEAGGESPTRRIRFPWFILWFVVAAVVSALLPQFGSLYAQASGLGRLGLTATLFAIGTGLSQRTLREVGWRPMVQGVALWILVGCGSLLALVLHVVSI